jgi:hypothetical protein
MGRIGRSFALAKASGAVLLSDKGMLGYMGLSAVFTGIALVIFAFPGIALALTKQSGDNGSSQATGPWGFLLLFLFYLLMSFISLFFNTALVAAALQRLRGREATFGYGMQIALHNIGHIFGFALISATVGVVLAIIEERFELVGQIVASIVGGAWAIVTFLVVPVMVAEGLDPFSGIKRSAQLLRKTWGEQIIGSGGIALVLFLFALVGVMPIVLTAVTGVGAVIAAGIALAVIYWAILFLVGSALNGIFRAAVYLYAETGQTPSQFDPGLLQDAFRPKTQPGTGGIAP